MTKFCQYCGAPLIKEDARFCISCGHPVGQAAQPSEQNTYNQNQYNQNQYNAGGYAPQQPYAQQQPQQGYQYGGQPPYQPPYQQPHKKKRTRGRMMLTVLLAMFVGAGAGVIYQYKAGKLGTKRRSEPLAAATTTTPEQAHPQPNVAKDEPKKSKAKDEPKKSKVKSNIKIKDEEFFGVTLPIPDIGKIIENSRVKVRGQEVVTIRIDSISYQEFIEYCKTLESLHDWKASKSYRVARFPKDYNEEPMVICAGSYGDLSNITVKYFSDELCEDPDTPHFNLTVGKL